MAAETDKAPDPNVHVLLGSDEGLASVDCDEAAVLRTLRT